MWAMQCNRCNAEGQPLNEPASSQHITRRSNALPQFLSVSSAAGRSAGPPSSADSSGCHSPSTRAAAAVADTATATSTQVTPPWVCQAVRSTCACLAARACRVRCFTRSKRACRKRKEDALVDVGAIGQATQRQHDGCALICSRYLWPTRYLVQLRFCLFGCPGCGLLHADLSASLPLWLLFSRLPLPAACFRERSHPLFPAD